MNRLSFLLVVALALVPPPFETLKAAPSQGGADVNELIAQLLDSLEQEGIDLADLANDGNENSVDSFDDPADRPGNASPHLKKHGPGKALRLLKKLRSRGSSAGVTRGDFNGDGFADLAIGVPHKDIPVNLPFGLGKTLVRDAGEVIVIYGSADGLVATSSTVPDSQVWHQEITGVV